jgi:hypothetical protein
VKHYLLKIKYYLCTAYLLLLLAGCAKDETFYYADGEDEGLAIFSNTANNLLTCYFDNRGWRSVTRRWSGFSPRQTFEVYVQRRTGTGPQDTLTFNWNGYYNEDNFRSGAIELVLHVPKNFSALSFNNLHRKRIALDTTTGYFTANSGGLIPARPKGTGSVYFHTALLDSTGPLTYFGRFNGLFEADFQNFKITRGRFDHTFGNENFNW